MGSPLSPNDTDEGESPKRARPLPQGSRVGRFEVRQMLGRGGMGTVYEAYDPRLDRSIALKLLHPEIAARREGRMRREAEGLAKLSHPNVVQVYNVGRAGGRLYIAMELAPGQTLAVWQREPRPWRECVEAYLQAGQGLAAAHQKRLVHRDFKPSNCIIDGQGRVRVLDFGLVCEPDTMSGVEVTPSQPSREQLPKALGEPLTRTGATLGTMRYMPLEQVEGRPADATGDQFAFCVSLYEALYRRHPFEWSNPYELALALDRGAVLPSPPDSDVPASLWRILARGLAREPGERWASMEVLLEALDAVPYRRTSTRWWWLGAVGVLGLGLAVSEVLRPPPPTCGGAEAKLAGVWDESTRALVATALRSPGSTAEVTISRVQQQLDDYAARWAQAHTEACADTHQRHAQSPEQMEARLRCLQGRLDHLRATIETLGEADAAVAHRAMLVVSGLPAVDACADPDDLEVRGFVPDDPEASARAGALRGDLARVKALNTAGKYDDGLAAAERLLDQARALGAEPLVAEVQLERGRLARALGDYDAAAEALQDAYFEAGRWDLARVRAQAAVGMSRLRGFDQASYEESRRWSRHAQAEIERVGDPVLRIEHLNHEGSVLTRAGHYEQALDRLREALSLWEELDEPPFVGVAGTHQRLAIVLEQQGHYDAAALEYRNALSVLAEEGGPEHPELAAVYNGLGNTLALQGRPEQALIQYQRAKSLVERTLGPEHPEVATSHNNVGAVLSQMGRHEESVEEFRTALTKRIAVVGSEHPDVSASHDNLGIALRMVGRYPEALAEHRKAQAIEAQVLGPGHPDLAFSHFNIAELLLLLDRLEEARAEHHQALSIWIAAVGIEHPMVAKALLGLVKDRLELGLTTGLVRDAEQVLEIYGHNNIGGRDLHDARFALALALWAEQREPLRARALAERAATYYRERGEAGRDMLVRVDRALAQHRAPR